jgi:hypothetical protein
MHKGASAQATTSLKTLDFRRTPNVRDGDEDREAFLRTIDEDRNTILEYLHKEPKVDDASISALVRARSHS